MKEILIIYFIGYIIAYIWLRKLNNTNDWVTILLAGLIAVISWVAIIFIIVILVFEKIKIKIPNPPKWL